jgi:predicted TIM-barrel fold metal-dependent hydrolase
VDLNDPSEVAQLRQVFRKADELGMAIVVHMRPSVTRHRPYGAREADIFLAQVLPAAPHVAVQIAHLAGAGGFDDPGVDQALQVFIAAIGRHDSRMQHVYFDICGVAGLGHWRDLIATRIREVGIERIVWGSDGAFGGGMTPGEALAAYQQLPLTPGEFRTIDRNANPYMR